MSHGETPDPSRRRVMHAVVLGLTTALALMFLTAAPPSSPPPPETVTSASPSWEPSAP